MIKEEKVTLYRQHGCVHYEEMVEFYNSKIELDKTNHLYWGERGLAHLELFLLDEAIFDLTQAVELKPDYAVGFYNRGRYYFEMEEYEKAIVDFEKSKNIDKALVVNDFYLGLCYSDFENYDKAIESYSSFLLDNPIERHNRDVLKWRAELYYLTNQKEKASTDIAELLTKDIEKLACFEKINEAKKFDNKSNVTGEINFANIFDEACQQRWISDLNYNILSGQKFDTVVRENLNDKLLLFKEKPYYEELIHLLANYFQAAIPNYLASEYNYWTINCLTNDQREEANVVIIIVNGIPVLSVNEEDDNSLSFKIIASKLPYLNYLIENGFDGFVNKISDYKIDVRDSLKDNDEGDVIILYLNEEQFKDALGSTLLLSSMRLFNLRMMNKVAKRQSM